MQNASLSNEHTKVLELKTLNQPDGQREGWGEREGGREGGGGEREREREIERGGREGRCDAHTCSTWFMSCIFGGVGWGTGALRVGNFHSW